MVDPNTRAAMLQTGRRSLLSPFPSAGGAAGRKQPAELVASHPSMQRYISMNVTQKPFDNPKVREAINYAIDRQALVKVAFAGYAPPATGVVAPSIAYAQRSQPWPYQPGKS
ncbi:ABC transporter substrate-binding protein [Shigella flexneri]